MGIDEAGLSQLLGVPPDAAWWSFAGTLRDSVSPKTLPPWSPVKAIRAPNDHTGLAGEVRELYSAERLAGLLKSADANGGLGFWSRHLCATAYPIGETNSGDPIVQIASGARAGEVLVTNHETYHGFLDELARFIGEGTCRPSFLEQANGLLSRKHRLVDGQAPSTAQVLALVLHEELDGPTRLAKSFGAFYALLKRGPSQRKQKTVLETQPLPPHCGKLQGTEGALGLFSGFDAERSRPDGGSMIFRAGWGQLSAFAFQLDFWVRGLFVRDDLMVAWGYDNNKSQCMARSQDKGQTFERASCALMIDSMCAESDGVLWAAVSDTSRSYFAWSDDQARTFSPVHLSASGLTRVFGPCRDGLLASCFDHLFVLNRKAPREMSPARNERIDRALETRSGAWLIATTQGVLRSDDSGLVWSRCEGTRPMSEARILVELSDGCVVVSDGERLFQSVDDGRSFAVVAHLKRETLTAIIGTGDGVVFVGSSLHRFQARRDAGSTSR